MSAAVKVWTGQRGDGSKVSVTALEVQAVRLFVNHAAEASRSGDDVVNIVLSAWMKAAAARSDDELARVLMVAKSEAAESGISMIDVVMDGEDAHLVHTEAR